MFFGGTHKKVSKTAPPPWPVLKKTLDKAVKWEDPQVCYYFTALLRDFLQQM